MSYRTGNCVYPEKPNRATDVRLAEICAWLKANGYTMHVSLKGHVELRRKSDGGPV